MKGKSYTFTFFFFKKKTINYKLSLLSFYSAITDYVNAHQNKKFSLLFLISLEASIADHCSSIFVVVFVTKTLYPPDVERAKLSVKLCLESQLSSTNVQAGEDRRSSRLRHCFLTLTHQSFSFPAQAGISEKLSQFSFQ